MQYLKFDVIVFSRFSKYGCQRVSRKIHMRVKLPTSVEETAQLLGVELICGRWKVFV